MCQAAKLASENGVGRRSLRARPQEESKADREAREKKEKEEREEQEEEDHQAQIISDLKREHAILKSQEFGLDRNYSQYHSLESIPGLIVTDTQGIMSMCDSVKVLDELISNLNPKGLREKALKENGQEDAYIDTKTVLLHPDAQTTLQRLVPLISVFARHAPRQKEAVIAAFNGAGRYTLMCGKYETKKIAIDDMLWYVIV